MGSRNVLDEILDKVDEIPLEDQDMLVELIRNKQIQGKKARGNLGKCSSNTRGI